MAVDQESRLTLIEDFTQLLDGIEEIPPLSPVQEAMKNVIGNLYKGWNRESSPIDQMYDKRFVSELLQTIHHSTRNLLENIKLLSRKDLVTGDTLKKTLAGATWPDKPPGQENTACVDVVNNIIEMAPGNTIDLAQSRTAMFALQVLHKDIDDCVKFLNVSCDNTGDDAKLGLFQLQGKVEEAIKASDSIDLELWFLVPAYLGISKDPSTRDSPPAVAPWFAELEKWSDMFTRISRFQHNLKDALVVVRYSVGFLRDIARRRLSQIQGLHACLMAGDVWSLKIAHRDWKIGIQDFQKTASDQLNRPFKSIIARQQPDNKDEIGKAYFSNLESDGKQPVQWKPEYTAADHVVVACGLTRVNAGVHDPDLELFGNTNSRTLGVIMPQDKPLELYAEKMKNCASCDLRTEALAVPRKYSQGIRFGTVNSTDSGWTKEVNSPSNANQTSKWRRRVTFASPFVIPSDSGNHVEAQCWIAQCRLDQGNLEGLHRLHFQESRKVTLDVKCIDVDQQGFDIVVEMSKSIFEMWHESRKLESFTWGTDRPPEEVEQSFTLNWIAVEPYTRPLRMWTQTNPRLGVGASFRWNWINFDEPPQVFYGIASLTYKTLNGLNVDLNCKRFRVGCLVTVDSPPDQQPDHLAIALVAIGWKTTEN